MVLIPEIRSIDFSIPISSVSSILFLVEPKRTGHKTRYPVYESFYVKIGLHASEKFIYSDQRARIAQAVLNRYLVILLSIFCESKASIFSFYHNVLYPFTAMFRRLRHMLLVVCNSFQIGQG